MSNLINKVEELPLSSGCYIFKNKRNEIIYIGKSKALRTRVKQYFMNTDSKEGKYYRLSKEISDVDIILTDTETDALILECKLIKRHKPKYNSQLKKTKTYPYIKIDQKLTYPSIYLVDEIKDDNCMYFGCFYSEEDAFQTIVLINRIWNTPLCCKEDFNSNNKSCLNFHLNKCCAPCDRSIDSEHYNAKVKEIVRCLNGNPYNTLIRLKKEMGLQSKSLNFEKAAKVRDGIEGLEKLQRKLKKLNTILKNRDVYLFFRAFNEVSFTLFFIRNGTTLNRITFSNIYKMDRERLTTFIDNVVEGKFLIDEGEQLTSYLLDISADKMFVHISNRMRKEKIIEKLQKEFGEYTNRE